MKQLTVTGALFCAVAGFWLAPAALADEALDRLNTEVQTLKAGQQAMQKDLQEIKKLLAGLKTPQRPSQASIRDIDVTLNVADDPQKGDTGARVTLVEFTDYQCPYCGRHLKTVMPEIEKNFVDTGKVRYVLRDYPLAFHPLAAKAHEAAHCAADQGRYWEMHDQLFSNQKALQPEKLPGYAETAGVADMAAFGECLASGRHTERGQQSVAEGAKAGVTGTPSFLLGLSGPDGTVKATKFIRGAQGYAVFEKHIKEMLVALEAKAEVDARAAPFGDILRPRDSDPLLVGTDRGKTDSPFCITPR